METVQNKVGVDELYKFAKTLIKTKNIPYDEDLIQLRQRSRRSLR